MISRFRLVVSLAVIIVISFAAIALAEEMPSTTGTQSLIVKLVPGLSQDEQAAVIAEDGGSQTSVIAALRLHVVSVDAADAERVLLNYQSDPRVESVEISQTRKVEAVPSDESYGAQWALPQIGWDLVYGVVAPIAIDPIKVAVLDTGVDASHPDLAGNVSGGTSVIDATDGTVDVNGHGTALAGIVAAVTDNGLGIAGVGFSGVQVMPVKVIGDDGTGQDADIINGIVYAVDHGASVILMGFSNPGFSQNLQDAIDYAWDNGVVVVAATGNDGISDPTYPAGDRGVIGVSATDSTDGLAVFSNYGADTFLAAPGVEITTTALNYVTYPSITGTSASAAIVAGVAAFMRAADPDATNGMIVYRLAVNADPAGTIDQTGNGRVNMARAVADTSLTEIEPEGAPGGGPYVGPYVIATYNLNSVDSPSVTEGNSGTKTLTFNVGMNGSGGGTTLYWRTQDGTATGGSSCGTSGVDYISVSQTNGSSEAGNFTVDVTICGDTDFESDETFTLEVADNSSFTGSGSHFKSGTGTIQNDDASCTTPSIDTQPSPQSITYGANASFSVTASGTSPTYQWQVDTGGGFVDVSNGGVYSGATTATLSLTLPPASMSGYQYRAVVTACSTSVNSNAATLTVDQATPTCSVTPYHVTFNNSSHTATGSCTGVGGASDVLSGLDLTGTTHTNAGDYPSDPWSFHDDNGNYKDDSGTVHDIIDQAPLTCTLNLSVQYSDPVQYPSSIENDSDCTGWVDDDGVSVFTSNSLDCSPTGNITLAPGTYTDEISCTGVSADNYDVTVSGDLTVTEEDAVVSDYSGPSSVLADSSTGKNKDEITIDVDVKELLDDVGCTGNVCPGDIRNASVTVTLSPVGGGASYNGTCVPDTSGITGNAYETLPVHCTWDAGTVPVNAYEVDVNIDNYYTGYTGSYSDVLVVYDPTLGFTTGGGWFYWPDSAHDTYPGDKTNFGYNMKYNKKMTNIQGSLLMIRHLEDGTIYRIKSNQLGGLAILKGTCNGEASFSGKATYSAPGEDTTGNNSFLVYVEDNNEPGKGYDRFWIQVKDGDGNVLEDVSLSDQVDEAKNDAQIINGGNIVVPHGCRK